MTDEQKAAIAAAGEAEKNGAPANPANANDPASEPIEGEDPAEAPPVEPSTPDYEAIAKAESERADAAVRAAAEASFKAREARRAAGTPPADPPEGDDDNAPLTRAEFKAELARTSESIEKKALESAALTVARANTASEAEAQAAMQFYRTRVVPTGNLEEDVLFAIGGLNHRRTAGRVREVARALQSKENALRQTAEPHREPTAATEPKISPADAHAIKQSGMVWDGVKRVYKKPLGDGSRHYYFDPKTKRKWMAS